MWRWDQGRLEYFIFENLKAIASCLVEVEGIEVNPQGIDPLRTLLEEKTGLPFLPTNYRVWRNYGRVFGCSLLAIKTGKHLFVSEIGRRLADGSIRDVDEYLTILIQRFRFPSPIFDSYDSKEPVIYPFVALLKYLLVKAENDPFPTISTEEVFSKIIGNACNGLESDTFYRSLKSTGVQPKGDQVRQVREMMLVVSQFSFLKWANKILYLDATFDLQQFLADVDLSLTPPVLDRAEEFAEMTRLTSIPSPLFSGQNFETPIDVLFTEGQRSRITHLKIERSPLLRKMFFKQPRTIQCDMCELLPRVKYPWTDNLLEIHHLLPLSSGIALLNSGTSLNDIVPLCPNCHRSIHVYYKIWLNGNQVNDFSNKVEAREVYKEAKLKIVL